MTPPDHPKLALSAGDRVGRYTLLSKLGQGGVGMVWRARDEQQGGADVALKLLRIYDRSLAARQMREATLTAEARSPHVVEVRDVFVHEAMPAIALELVEGPSLLELLRRRRLDPDEVDALAAALTRGLGSVHAAGLVHRDVKPGNILLPDGDVARAKVADFGLARTLAADVGPGLTQTGLFLGTPGYAAPEQIVDARRVDARADVFALAVVLYRMLVGRMPFAAADRWEVLRRTRDGDHVPLADARPDLPDRMGRAISGGLQVRLDRRIPDASVFGAVWEGRRDWPWPERADDAEEAETEVERLSDVVPVLEPDRSEIASPPQPLLGRRAELEAVHGRFAGGARIVTLLGTAGVGKSRLAVEVATDRQGLGLGPARQVTLEGLTTAGEVCAAVGRVLGVRGGRAAAVGAALARQGIGLILLDGAEGAAEELGGLLAGWSSDAPGTLFLVTSRLLLGVRGEQVVEVGPLEIDAALQLFVERAEAVRPDFAIEPEALDVLRTLVSRLDRLPLAIELAAARVRMLGPRDLLERLDERLDLVRRGVRRAAGLDDAVAWSWSLLEPWARAALAQLSVFRGGFTLEAAEAVIDIAAFRGAPWPMDAVQLLVDHSLVQSVERVRGVQRFVPYGAVRAFAADRLTDSREGVAFGVQAGDAARDRHARYFATLGARSAMRKLDGPGGPRRARALWLERDNLLAATKWAIERVDGAAAAGSALAAAWLHRVHGPHAAGVALLGAVVSVPGVPPEDRARIYRNHGRLLLLGGRREEASESLRRALADFRGLGDLRSEGIVLGNLGDLLGDDGDQEAAEQHYRAALELLRGSGDRASQGVVLGNLANLLRARADLDGAARAYEEGLALSRAVGDRRAEGITLSNLGALHYDAGRRGPARDAFDHAILLVGQLGDRGTESLLRSNRALLDRDEGRIDQARTGFERSIELAREVGNGRYECLARGNLGELLWQDGDVAGAAGQLEEAIQLGDAGRHLFAGIFRGSLALVIAKMGDVPRSRRLLQRGEEQLRDRDDGELARLLLKRAVVERDAGDEAAAEGAVQAADQLVAGVSVDEAYRRLRATLPG